MSCRYAFAGRDPITGMAHMASVGKNCQKGGRIKKRKSKKKNNKSNIKKTRNSRISKKKLDREINVLCSKMNKKCTPKYKSLLKKIVLKNLY